MADFNAIIFLPWVLLVMFASLTLAHSLIQELKQLAVFCHLVLALTAIGTWASKL